MNLPDDFRDDGSLFPSIAQLGAERRDALVARQAKALARMDSGFDELGYLAGNEESGEPEEWGVAKLEALARDLDALVARHFPHSAAAKRAAGEVAQRGGWA